MGRIISYPTATPSSDDYFVMDNFEEGVRSISFTQLVKIISSMIDIPSSEGTENVSSGGGPIGEVISYMGTNAPDGYLICDGSEYSISKYPDLAKHFANSFGKSNFFGGDGTETFAVPDLQGEFLRGAGTNTHATSGNGSDVGVHQAATLHQNVRGHNNKIYIFTDNNSTGANTSVLGGTNPDYVFGIRKYDINAASGTNAYSDNVSPTIFSSRPTNTSVLFCIKYKATQYANLKVDRQTSHLIFDGKTKAFDLPESDVEYSVYVNGLYMTEGVDYTIDEETNQIIFNDVFDDFDTCTLTYYV